MAEVTLVVFHTPPCADDPPLTRLLAEARQELLAHHVEQFRRAGVDRVVLVAGRAPSGPRATEGAVATGGRGRGDLPALRRIEAPTFGEALRTLVQAGGIEACVVLGSGAVPLLTAAGARRLVATASTAARRTALTNNRYSSDACAISLAGALAELPALPSDNALPRWLEEVAGYDVAELTGRDRLALDLDTPLDLALLALAPRVPGRLRRIAVDARLAVPRLAALRGLAADPRRELLVFGRSSSRTLAWLERHVRCRVRFLAEERGMRAASPLAIGTALRPGWGTAAHETTTAGTPRRPRATIGRLLEDRGPEALPTVIRELADGAILDSRVLLADRLGADEATWPSPEDRFASDLLRPDGIADPWLRALTAAAATTDLPIVLGGHTLVGPGIPLLLRGIR